MSPAPGRPTSKVMVLLNSIPCILTNKTKIQNEVIKMNTKLFSHDSVNSV